MEVKKENLLSAYKVADEKGKEMLKTLFPSVEFEKEVRPVMERIKTFEDAKNELGSDNPFVSLYDSFVRDLPGGVQETDKDVLALLKLRIITAALNEGWEPVFDGKMRRYYPYYVIYTKEEMAKMSEKKKEELGLVGANAFDGSRSGLAYVYSSNDWSNANTSIGSRLAYKSSELAEYSGKQFKDIWVEYCTLPMKV